MHDCLLPTGLPTSFISSLPTPDNPEPEEGGCLCTPQYPDHCTFVPRYLLTFEVYTILSSLVLWFQDSHCFFLDFSTGMSLYSVIVPWSFMPAFTWISHNCSTFRDQQICVPSQPHTTTPQNLLSYVWGLELAAIPFRKLPSSSPSLLCLYETGSLF